ncbi:MAG: hypothetical protein MZV64_40690 [Ignavibacteriales bacterium]|nr:hypothetical protein [Ignavibacteriales bacterium]
MPNNDFEKDTTGYNSACRLYNELYVIERLIDKVCEIEYPKDKTGNTGS